MLTTTDIPLSQEKILWVKIHRSPMTSRCSQSRGTSQGGETIEPFGPHGTEDLFIVSFWSAIVSHNSNSLLHNFYLHGIHACSFRGYTIWATRDIRRTSDGFIRRNCLNTRVK